MAESPSNPGVIHRDTVRLAKSHTLIDCGSAAAGRGQGAIAVVPLLDGDRIAGFEIRCGCGSSAVVECVYPNEA